MIRHIFTFILTALLPLNIIFCQNKTSDDFITILDSNKNEFFQHILANKDKFRLQIIYTEINRDKNNKPYFKTYYYNVNKDLYFNPASTVKLPASILSLQKLNELNTKGVNKNTILQIDSVRTPQTKQLHDKTAENGYPSIAHFIKEALIISENNPYTRMYEFLGQEYLNKELWKRGYNEARIIRRFASFDEEQNRYTNPMRFLNNEGALLYSRPEAYCNITFNFPKQSILIAKNHWDNNDNLHEGPMDFTKHNNIGLESLLDMVKTVMFPKSMPKRKQFNLTDSDYYFLRKYMSQFPGETNYPKYDKEKYFDSYVKFFFNDSTHINMPDNVRVFNKVGWSYGFMTDASYIVDFDNNIEFLLAATIYANEDEVINDGIYEYDTVAHPFLYQLGQTVYNYELRRGRKFIPDLSEFKIVYDTQDNDSRPIIKSAYN